MFRVERLYIAVLALGLLLANGQWLNANDTIYVSGGIQHDGLFPTRDVSAVRTAPRAEWAKIDIEFPTVNENGDYNDYINSYNYYGDDVEHIP